jgi:hypothetical protein
LVKPSTKNLALNQQKVNCENVGCIVLLTVVCAEWMQVGCDEEVGEEAAMSQSFHVLSVEAVANSPGNAEQ